MIVEVVFAILLLLSLINISFAKKQGLKVIIAVIFGYLAVYLPYYILQVHFHRVLKSAFAAYKEKKEIPKMFANTKHHKAVKIVQTSETTPVVKVSVQMQPKDSS